MTTTNKQSISEKQVKEFPLDEAARKMREWTAEITRACKYSKIIDLPYKADWQVKGEKKNGSSNESN